jgi:hypothetical protein
MKRSFTRRDIDSVLSGFLYGIVYKMIIYKMNQHPGILLGIYKVIYLSRNIELLS